jgi:transposase
MEQARSIRLHIPRTCFASEAWRSYHDRRNALKNAPDGSQSAKKGDSPRLIGRTKGGLNTKLHAICDEKGRPIDMLLTAGNVHDIKGASKLLDRLPEAKVMLADRGYDADWFRAALQIRGLASCIPSKRNRNRQIAYDTDLYKKRHMIENMFAKFKDWRRIAMRYDRCAHTFFSAICIAAVVIWYLD